MENNYRHKYLKYKNKYIASKNMSGGGSIYNYNQQEWLIITEGINGNLPGEVDANVTNESSFSNVNKSIIEKAVNDTEFWNDKRGPWNFYKVKMPEMQNSSWNSKNIKVYVQYNLQSANKRIVFVVEKNFYDTMIKNNIKQKFDEINKQGTVYMTENIPTDNDYVEVLYKDIKNTPILFKYEKKGRLAIPISRIYAE